MATLDERGEVVAGTDGRDESERRMRAGLDEFPAPVLEEWGHEPIDPMVFLAWLMVIFLCSVNLWLILFD